MGCTKVRPIAAPDPIKNTFGEIIPENGGVFSLLLETSLGLHRNVQSIHGRNDDEFISLSLTARTPETRKALKTLEAHINKHARENTKCVRAEFLPIGTKASKRAHILFITFPK